MDRRNGTVAQYVEKRLDSLQYFIPTLSSASDLDEWEKQALGCLLIRTRTHYRHLAESHRIAFDTERIAWSARTLMEILVWTKYASSSTDHARRFYQDHALDLQEFQVAGLKLASKFTPDDPQLQTLQGMGTILGNYRSLFGLTSSDKRLQLREVADEVGMAEIFTGLNRVCSKLVHATAFSVLLPLSTDVEETVRNWFFGVGANSANDTLNLIAARLATLDVDVGPIV